MSRKYQNRSNFNTYQNRIYNNDINLKDINSQKKFVNDYEEKNYYNNTQPNSNNLHSNFGEYNWSQENHGRDLGEKNNTNRIIKNQANDKQNNYSNNNQRNLNYISPNYNKYSNDKNLNYNLSQENHGRGLVKNSDKNPNNYKNNTYSNNNKQNQNNISLNHNEYSNDDNLNYNCAILSLNLFRYNIANNNLCIRGCVSINNIKSLKNIKIPFRGCCTEKPLRAVRACGA